MSRLGSLPYQRYCYTPIAPGVCVLYPLYKSDNTSPSAQETRVSRDERRLGTQRVRTHNRWASWLVSALLRLRAESHVIDPPRCNRCMSVGAEEQISDSTHVCIQRNNNMETALPILSRHCHLYTMDRSTGSLIAYHEIRGGTCFLTRASYAYACRRRIDLHKRG